MKMLRGRFADSTRIPPSIEHKEEEKLHLRPGAPYPPPAVNPGAEAVVVQVQVVFIVSSHQGQTRVPVISH